MKNICIIFNPLAGNKTGTEIANSLAQKLNALAPFDMTAIKNYQEFFASHAENDIVICGGDGTLNRFINDTAGVEYSNDIYYFPSGSGNDFWRDTGAEQDTPLLITEYLRDLPICTVNGKDYRFINGIGYGIDGYCCQKGDELRAAGVRDINYTSIAIKGLLFHYKPTAATVTVDGVAHHFKKAWIAPTMKGRFYGGGMIPTPDQDRFDPEEKLSVMVFHTTGRLRTLMIFPSIFKGEHVSHTNAVTVLSGKQITVEFDSPRPLQVDGETILDVSSYTACSCSSQFSKEERQEAQTAL